MTRAIALALRGWGQVAPNPLVGAVLMQDGEVIAEGHHAALGAPHAEVSALAAAANARGATCVVPLEPCAHHGRTPPCADALIAAGVARVVAAVRDPNPVARGGVERLRDAGIEVYIGLGAAEAAGLNAGFLWAATRPERPFVALKLATSLDGFIADAAGQSRWVSGAEARDFVQWLRAGFDAIAVGRRTAEADDPHLTVRGAVTPRTPPMRVVMSASGQLRADLMLVTSARDVPTTVVTRTHARDPLAQRLEPHGVRVLGADTLTHALEALRALEVRTVLVEGGGTLAGALLDADLVDRLYWIQAPLWLGDGVRAFHGVRGHALPDVSRWTVVERTALGADTLLVVDRQPCLPES